MTVVQHRGNQSGNVPNEMRGRSPFIWATFPIADIKRDSSKGYFFEEDFIDFIPVAAGAEASFGRWRGFASTGGSVVESTTLADVGGVAEFSSDGDDEGAGIRQPSQPFAIYPGAPDFAMECRVKRSSIDNTKRGLFIGLIQSTTLTATSPIAAAGTLADLNFVGFHFLEGDGDQCDCVYKADGVTQVTVQADAIPTDYALAADGWVKLGATFTSKDNKFRWFVNGVEVASVTVISTAGTDFPNDVKMGLVITMLNATGTTPGKDSFDWIDAGQRAA